jgi:hypothetical protein
MAMREGTHMTSPVRWLSDAEYVETLRRAVDGDGEALHALFFGPPQ